jgi:DNA repair exonuclease SbcCD ATPase subunit
MQRGFAFKLMPPKAIVDVLTMIGVHPAVTPENIDKPTPEMAAVMYQALSEFCYDMDVQQVKGRATEVPSVEQFVEIFDEALDVITTFKLARQLAFINRVEDFSMKDVWDPQSKRLRAILSGIINFCRYKESQTGIVQTMKEEVQNLDQVRLELVDKSNVVGDQLAQAQAQHSAELQDMWDAENALQEARETVDKLQKQQATADRMHEQAETKTFAAKEKLGQSEQRAEQLREHIASLQEQVAESPEGLERELQELQQAIRTQKARLDEKSDLKRSRTQRVQVLKSLKGNIDNYKGLLDKVGQAADVQATACDRTSAARGELSQMRSSLEARRGEDADLKQSLDQVSLDMEAAKQAHEEQVRQCDELRQKAMERHQELMGKRTEEQKQFDELQAERMKLETDIANVKRAYDAEMDELQAKLKQIQQEGEEYIQTVDGLMKTYNAEMGRAYPAPGNKSSCMASPGSAMRAQRRSTHTDAAGYPYSPGIWASPSPRRLH